MNTQTRIHFKFDAKLPFIKALRGATQMGLKETKEASERGWVDVDPDKATEVARALQAWSTFVSYDPPLEMRHALMRLETVSARLGTRLVNTLALGLECIDAALGSVK